MDNCVCISSVFQTIFKNKLMFSKLQLEDENYLCLLL